MQTIPRWRTLLISRNSIAFSSTQFAYLHSTPICNEKIKRKSDFKGGNQNSRDGNQSFKGAQQSSKNHIRFLTRQKRADTKKALWNLVDKYVVSGTPIRNDVPFSKASDSISQNAKNVNSSKTSTKKGRFKNVVCPKSPKKKAHVFRDSYSSTPSKKRNAKKDSAEKINKHRMKRMYQKRHASNDDDEHPETVFHATFGDRAYTWSFNSWTGSSQRSTPRFDWGEFFHRTSDQQQRWQASHESDSENEVCDVGLRSERVILGLPQNGVLKLKDVKNAFHLSALKWHPDKHQGPSQAAAEEKFKLCVSAYNSLCSALSGN
ncbi:unnamed protein product [Amaranthus hypochondriacus]